LGAFVSRTFDADAATWGQKELPVRERERERDEDALIPRPNERRLAAPNVPVQMRSDFISVGAGECIRVRRRRLTRRRRRI